MLMITCDLMLTCSFYFSSVYPFRKHGKLVLLLPWILASWGTVDWFKCVVINASMCCINVYKLSELVCISVCSQSTVPDMPWCHLITSLKMTIPLVSLCLVFLGNDCLHREFLIIVHEWHWNLCGSAVCRPTHGGVCVTQKACVYV